MTKIDRSRIVFILTTLALSLGSLLLVSAVFRNADVARASEAPTDPQIDVWPSKTGALPNPQLVKDINTIAKESNPNLVTRVNNTLFFAADDNLHGYELWKSDGTITGTMMIKDISQCGSSNPSHLTDVNGVLFFAADDCSNGNELWKSDGTITGTVMVKNITFYASSSSIDYLTNVNGTLFFVYDDSQLWKSDGTETGTVLVKNIPMATDVNLIAIGDKLFFAANSSSGSELWKSDGTEAGTVQVKDINPGSNSSNPTNFYLWNGTLFFVADDGRHGRELWKSDGSEAGTVLVKDINPGSAFITPGSFATYNGDLYFRTSDSTGLGLWKSNGTESGTVLVKELTTAGLTDIKLVGQAGASLYFMGVQLIGANDWTYSLWKSDGSAVGTVLVKTITPPLNNVYPWPAATILGENVLFKGYDAVHGWQLWKSTGTEIGTTMVKAIGTGNIADLIFFVTMNNALYFRTANTTNGSELWKSDGSENGTQLVKDIAPGTDPSMPEGFVDVNGTLFFAADDGIHGKELWKKDGVTGEFLLVKDIYTGTQEDFREWTHIEYLTNVSGTLFFAAEDQLYNYFSFR